MSTRTKKRKVGDDLKRLGLDDLPWCTKIDGLSGFLELAPGERVRIGLRNGEAVVDHQIDEELLWVRYDCQPGEGDWEKLLVESCQKLRILKIIPLLKAELKRIGVDDLPWELHFHGAVLDFWNESLLYHDGLIEWTERGTDREKGDISTPQCCELESWEPIRLARACYQPKPTEVKSEHSPLWQRLQELTTNLKPSGVSLAAEELARLTEEVRALEEMGEKNSHSQACAILCLARETAARPNLTPSDYKAALTEIAEGLVGLLGPIKIGVEV